MITDANAVAASIHTITHTYNIVTVRQISRYKAVVVTTEFSIIFHTE